MCDIGTPYRIVCEGWVFIDGRTATGDGIGDYDAWYYLDHVGAFAGRQKNYVNAVDMVFPTQSEAEHWAALASAPEAADQYGIVPVLVVEADAD